MGTTIGSGSGLDQDKTPVAATVGNGGLAPSGPGAMEEWLAFNASVRRAGEWKDRLSFPAGVASSEAETFCNLEGSLATLERGGDDPPPRGWARYPRARRKRGTRSRASAGSPRARRRSPRRSEGVWMGHTTYMGRVLGFFESFPFFQIERRL